MILFIKPKRILGPKGKSETNTLIRKWRQQRKASAEEVTRFLFHPGVENPWTEAQAKQFIKRKSIQKILEKPFKVIKNFDKEYRRVFKNARKRGGWSPKNRALEERIETLLLLKRAIRMQSLIEKTLGKNVVRDGGTRENLQLLDGFFKHKRDFLTDVAERKGYLTKKK